MYVMKNPVVVEVRKTHTRTLTQSRNEVSDSSMFFFGERKVDEEKVVKYRAEKK